MTYVIHQRRKTDGKSIGFVKRMDDHRRAAIFDSHAAAAHVASHIAMEKGFTTEVLPYDYAFGADSADSFIIHA